MFTNNPIDSEVRAALYNAQLHGVSKPLLNIGNYSFTLAPPYGANPDWIYVKYKKQYAGKLKHSAIQLLDDIIDEGAALELAAILNSSQQELYNSLIEYGRKTGICGCCGRTLTNGLSITLGIGPICREKYGFSVAANSIAAPSIIEEALQEWASK